MSEQPKCPEREKLLEVHEESQTLGLFMEWLFSNHGVLCRWYDDEYEEGMFCPTYESIESILADYFNIDRDKAEQEREELMAWLRGNQVK